MRAWTTSRDLPESGGPDVQCLSDFVLFCRVERRLSDLTCKAFERDLRARIEFLRSQGISTLLEVRTSDLRRFLAYAATRSPTGDPALFVGVLAVASPSRFSA